MHFLPDVYRVRCGGARYNHETLEVKAIKERILVVLEMSVTEALLALRNAGGSIGEHLQTLDGLDISNPDSRRLRHLAVRHRESS